MTIAGPIKSNDLELLEELVLGPSTGGRRQATPLAVSIVRSLVPDDLPLLRNPPAQGSKPKSPLQLRHSHHQIARLVAAGKADYEIAFITGYNPAYICNLKSGQDFKDLISYYEVQKDQIFIDVMERMKAIGLNTLDEIQRRFEEAPEAFTAQQLMDLTELMLIKPARAAQQGQSSGPPGGSGAGVTVNVQFVAPQAQPSQMLETHAERAMIDITPKLDRVPA